MVGSSYWGKGVAMFTVARYGRRYWAVLAPTGELVCVTLYRKGAEEVARRLSPQ